MKKTLSFGILLTVVAWAGAQEVTTTVQVAPSDQVIYPDASQILNKTEPKADSPPAKPLANAPLPSAKPLVASTPVPAKPLPPAGKPGTASGAKGWYLRWTVTGDEAGVRAWAAPRGSVQMQPLGPDLWEVLAGPLTGAELKQALEGQAGLAQLVKR